MRTLEVERLTSKDFAQFGEVIEIANTSQKIIINEGHTTRFHDLTKIDTADEGGDICISIFRTNPVEFPFYIKKLERHPMGSQMFMPMNGKPYLVVVGSTQTLSVNTVRVFLAGGHQGVNFAKNTWHHYSLALEPNSDFLVVDRKGSGKNLEETQINVPLRLMRPSYERIHGDRLK